MDFLTKIKECIGDGIGLCVGLDTDPGRIPEPLRNSTTPLLDFNLGIIEATADYASAYKPNLAFYEAHGASGWQQLAATVKAIPRGRLVILDAKRGDIGSTASAYASAMFDGLGGDAVTVNPYLGSDSLQPFVERPDRGAFVLAITSNPGGRDIQDLRADGKAIYEHVIDLAKSLNVRRNVGLVVGATRVELLESLLGRIGDMPLLIPGVGTQGGDVRRLREALSGYKAPALVNASRSIIYASSGSDYQDAARRAAASLRGELGGNLRKA